jgi:pyridoxal phosphate enzyme (YggS family)
VADLAERLAQIRQSISDECGRLARPEPTLIVVTKNHDVNLARDLYDLGERDFGENRVQEGLPKSILLTEALPAANPNWHLIGQLQTNKVKQALQFAETIHSLDRPSLLEELAKRSLERPKPLDVFIQVNLTPDSNRGGVSPSEVEKFADLTAGYPQLNLRGLMGVASLDRAPAEDFETVANLSLLVQKSHPNANQLSIGMSDDFKVALGFGATHLRIGTAITGKRQY